jgi:hypothetical protein
MWRPAGEDRVLLMAGRTTRYAMEPRGEYVVGVVASRPMRSRASTNGATGTPGAWPRNGLGAMGPAGTGRSTPRILTETVKL